MNSDSKILDELIAIYEDSLHNDVPKKRKEYSGNFSDGYIRAMEVNAEFILEFIKENREQR